MPHTAQAIESAIKSFLESSERKEIGALIDPEFLAEVCFKKFSQYDITMSEIKLALEATGETARVTERFNILSADWPNTPPMTAAQKAAIYRIWQRDQNPPGQTFEQFRETVQTGSGCLMVKVGAIWIGIEPDGYTHS